jgi:putative PIN family toxin of toxin-antitoxin system
MRIVIDTSVLVAGLRSRFGASNRLLEMVAFRQCIPLCTTAMFMEYESVLRRPENAFLAAFASAAEPVEIDFMWRPQLTDPADEMLLEAAVNGRAQYIVTHNVSDFLPAAKLFGISIVTPGKFVKEIAP